MAKYKERWPNPLNPVLIGYLDTETGKQIPNAPGNKDYQLVVEWMALGNLPDPAYTPQEIADYQAAKQKTDDINDSREINGIWNMSIDERIAYVQTSLQGATGLGDLEDKVISLLQEMIAYI